MVTDPAVDFHHFSDDVRAEQCLCIMMAEGIDCITGSCHYWGSIRAVDAVRNIVPVWDATFFLTSQNSSFSPELLVFH